jgi:peptidoglycan/LPS O-acetylase OafA/YrhL
MDTQKKPYFPALDGFRFIAFLLIFLHHASMYLPGSISGNIFWTFFNNNGWIGVDGFFILTGFLITYLLLYERQSSGSYSIRSFWWRRAIRIWPLYYLALVMGYIGTPYLFEHILHIHYLTAAYSVQIKTNLPWYMAFLGNWNIVRFGWGDLRSISELWAISLDQQFYIVWPIILLFINNFRTVLRVSIGIIAGSILTRIYLTATGTVHPGIYVNSFARLDPFMFGVIIAGIVFFKPDLLGNKKRLFTVPLQLSMSIALILFLYFTGSANRLAIRNGIWEYLPIDGAITYFVVSCISGSSGLIKLLQIRSLRYLGRISYGLYVWHILALELAAYFTERIRAASLLPVAGFGLAVLLAYLSYRFIETPFMRLKKFPTPQ